MAARCKVCAHPRRVEIDGALAIGTPLKLLARRFGVSHYSLSRHRVSGHIPRHVFKLMRESAERRGVDVARLREELGDGLVYALSARKAQLEDLFRTEAEAERSINAALVAKECRAHDEALARICGEVAPRVQQHVHVLATAEWQAIRTALVRRARENPALRGAILDALGEVEHSRPHVDGIAGRGAALIEHATTNGSGAGEPA